MNDFNKDAIDVLLNDHEGVMAEIDKALIGVGAHIMECNEMYFSEAVSMLIDDICLNVSRHVAYKVLDADLGGMFEHPSYQNKLQALLDDCDLYTRQNLHKKLNVGLPLTNDVGQTGKLKI